MKKFLNIVIRHIEKFILTFLMLVFIVLLIIQLRNINNMRGQIKEVRDLQVDVSRQKKQIEPIDESRFIFVPDVQEVWMPSYTMGPWKEYAKDGDPRIFRSLKNAPPSPPISEEYREYMMEYGAGSLFDPLLYVRPLDGKNVLLGFESVYAFYPPYNLDIPVVQETTTTTDPGKVTPDPSQITGAEDELYKLFRFVKADVPYLPIMFKSLMASNSTNIKDWDVVFDVYEGNRIRNFIVKMGNEIGQSGFRLTDGKAIPYEDKSSGTAITKYNYEVTITNIDTNESYTLKRGERPVDPNKPIVYEFVFFPTVADRKIYRLTDRQEVKLEWNKITETYRFIVVENKPYLERIPEGKPAANVTPNRYPIPGWRREEWLEWQKQNPSTGTPMGPSTGPGPILPPTFMPGEGKDGVIIPKIGN